MTKLDKIIELLESGKTLYFTTRWKCTKITKKHIPLLSSKTKTDGEHIYIRNVDYTYTHITYN